MIDKREIMDFAEKLGLEARIVEKDYILGWMLAGIHRHPALQNAWVFKGGTCLKKCYFETYRFSEDLDFTLRDASHLAMDFLTATFTEVAAWVSEQSGIEIPIETISFDIHPDPSKQYVEGRIGYAGPMGRTRGNVTKIKLDISANEILALPPVEREVSHPYSDRPADGIRTLCYAYEEVFAEKVRALSERLRPRDLYDVVHLFRHQGLISDRPQVLKTLEKKCDFKGIPVPTMRSIENHPFRGELEPDWERMLKHQLANLPTMDSFWLELPAFFDWLIGGQVKPLPQAYETGDADSTPWLPARWTRVSDISGPIERIRMAAANQVCIYLRYKGEKRTVEPYSFRRSSSGDLLFFGYHQEDHKMKCFRVDRFEGVEVTNTPFTPRYAIEINSGGTFRS